MTDNELDLYLGQEVVVHIVSGVAVRGTFQRGQPQRIDASATHGFNVSYDVLSQGPDGPFNTALVAEQIERIELAGLSRAEAAAREARLHDLGEANGLIINGYVPGTGHRLTQFRAGRITLEPDPRDAALPHHSQFRLWYTSWDDERRRDVTEMTDDEFVAFMAAEPDGLTELKG